MAGRVHLVRHAEAVHNVEKDFSRRDPELTPLGNKQAVALATTFPYSNDIGIVISSPLRRTIQTTLLAFPHVLDQRYYERGSGKGVEGGAELIFDPDLQERSALPCDTGSDRTVLEQEFPRLEFASLEEGWTSKEGVYGAGDEAVEKRAERARKGLRDRGKLLVGNERRDVVVVTHGVFMKFLSGDGQIDLPKAGWKSFSIEEDEKGDVVLLPI
ncbi:phosphoglycerate mutase-like protein [Stipitochalara longipes BDJ]|nr:phosphoglycerate mutase-like protein [Stipitochalara longipes BDJ]